MKGRAHVISLAAAAVILAGADAFAAPYLDLSGRQWRDPIETKDFSWNQIAAVCGTDGVGVCDGTLTGDPADDVFTGWTWATRDQVRDLLKEITGAPGAELTGGDYLYFTSPVQSWIADSGFSVTAIDPDELCDCRYIQGLTSTVDGTVNEAYFGAVFEENIADRSQALVLFTLATNEAAFGVGTFLYKPAAPVVPEPTTLWLFGTGLTAAAALRRRRSR